MRADADAGRIRLLARELGRSDEPARIYLTGGATAVLEGWRDSTIDVDLRIEPESDEIFRRIAEAKEKLDVNVELASPIDFIPEPPGWRDRSPFLFREGSVDFHTFDPCSQALAKIERDFELDRADVTAMLERGLVEPGRLRDLFDQIEPQLHRFPAIDAASFRERLDRALAGR